MRIAVLATAISLGLVSLALAGPADAVIKRATNIAPQELGSALRILAAERHLQILYTTDLVANRRTAGAIGDFTADKALSQILQGTGLTFRYIDSNTITLAPRDTAVDRITSPLPSGIAAGSGRDPAQDEQKARRSFWSRFRLAHVDQEAVGSSSAIELRSSQSQSAGELEEIVVTAQKYRQAAFDVPISMTVIGGADLKALRIEGLEDLQFYVPGMFVDNEGNSIRITIDGISNLTGQGALVGTYLDEADVTSEGSFGIDLNSYDMSRVEVLKGPQGTLYGEGAVGGTVRYITNRPVLSEFQMTADVAALFDQYGAPEERVETAVNVPVIQDAFALRIATDLDNGGGWINQPATNRKAINSRNLADARIEARWDPLATLTVDAMEVIHRETSGPYAGENPAGIYTQVFGPTTTPQLTDNYDVSNVTINWNPGLVSVVNSTTYFTHHNDESNDGTEYQLTAPPSQQYQQYFPLYNSVDESVSDELRVAGSGGERWRWMLGGFFKTLDDSTPLTLYYFGLPGPSGSPLPPPYPDFGHVHSNSKSAFSDTNYRLFGSLVLGAGVRYFKDGQGALLVGDAGPEKAEFTSVDPRFYARYRLSRNVNVYASAAKGFRSGGFNGLGYPQYQPERLWTYDLGTKASLLNGRMSINADAFLSDYNGYQIVGIPPGQSLNITSNAGNARVKGAEGEVAWSPADEWRLGVNGDYVNGRFTSISVQGSQYNVADPVDDVPRYQVTASAQRDLHWRDRSGFVRIDYTQRARATLRARDIGPWYYSQSDYMYLLGFHAGIDWTSRLAFGFFAQNLLNVRGFVGSDQIEMYAPREQPRTFGVSFDIKIY